MVQTVPSLQCYQNGTREQCTAYNDCDSHIELQGFVFNFELQGEENSTLRVPLQTFMATVDGVGYRNPTCLFEV